MKVNINNIIEFRRELHKFPELSGYEKSTALRVLSRINELNPDKTIVEIGGHGIAVFFSGNKPGPTVLFRTELDALPINDINDIDYRSQNVNVGHKCGHDGHMAIIIGLAEYLSKNKPKKGNVVLLFQPAEETGEGAERMIEDRKFKEINPDYVFALHNLPGFHLHDILVKDNSFASASKGMIIKLNGKSSHAGEPENGVNPAMAVSKIVNRFYRLKDDKDIFNDYVLITIIHLKLGGIAFGTSPGYAEVMATLRSYKNADMDILSRESVKIVNEVAEAENLNFEISWTEEFLAIENDKESNDIIRKAANENKLNCVELKKPFRWSEDFSHFLINYNGALFGLGAGKTHAQLHNPDYDFPDEIIESGIKMFVSIYKQILS